MSTIDTFARVARATGVTPPPLEYLRGKWVQRVLVMHGAYVFTTSMSLVACSLDPSHGNFIYLSFDEHDCPRHMAEKMYITSRNHVFIAPNSTALFAD